jgi:hypothetical protein
MIAMRKTGMLALLGAFALLLAACGPSEAELTPTVNPDTIRTEAVSTFASSLTQTATARATATLTLTPLPTLTLPALSTPLGGLTTGTPAAGGTTALCTRLVYVADVTVPDNTQMTPGQSFTKTWRVQNSGSCEWKAGFKFSLVSGDAMSGQAVTLPAAVAAGTTYEISVPMVAPTNKTGTIRGDWRMADDKGAFFGDAVYVQIVVGGTAATSTTGPTNTTGAPTASPTVTMTPTP